MNDIVWPVIKARHNENQSFSEKIENQSKCFHSSEIVHFIQTLAEMWSFLCVQLIQLIGLKIVICLLFYQHLTANKKESLIKSFLNKINMGWSKKCQGL